MDGRRQPSSPELVATIRERGSTPERWDGREGSRIGWSYTEEGRRRAATTEFGQRRRRAYGEQRRRSGRRQLATGRLLALLPRAKERRGSKEGEREMHYRVETDAVTSGRRRGSELSGLGPGKGKETAPGVPRQLLARTPASPARAMEEGSEDGGSKAARARWWRGNEREGDGAARFNRWQCRFREEEPTLAVKESELAVIDACSQGGDRTHVERLGHALQSSRQAAGPSGSVAQALTEAATGRSVTSVRARAGTSGTAENRMAAAGNRRWRQRWRGRERSNERERQRERGRGRESERMSERGKGERDSALSLSVVTCGARGDGGS
uniref:Uncharacterized protein n=1 Tax=Oryza sativa subsp. japonica TaxID=39947 RepID=Q6ZG35_ORYSJ|nr:hypothetical protein [Oryza sativa Japonica Group]BAD09215.1 hypothetical protein [Oryza sativa Japonica Group]